MVLVLVASGRGAVDDVEDAAFEGADGFGFGDRGRPLIRALDRAGLRALLAAKIEWAYAGKNETKTPADPPSLVVDDLCPAPTTEQRDRANELICDELIGELPFVGEADLTHAVALLLSFIRPMIDGPTPMHLIDAPTPRHRKDDPRRRASDRQPGRLSTDDGWDR